MGEGDVPQVVAERPHPHHRAPVVELLVGRKQLLNVRVTGMARDDVEDAASQIQHAEAVLAAAVRVAASTVFHQP